MKRIKLELTEDQQKTLIELVSQRVQDINDYIFEEDDPKALKDEKAFLMRLYSDLYR